MFSSKALISIIYSHFLVYGSLGHQFCPTASLSVTDPSLFLVQAYSGGFEDGLGRSGQGDESINQSDVTTARSHKCH